MAERTAVWVKDGVATGSVEARLMTESLLDQMGPVGAADLAVTWTAGMGLSVAAGRAFIRSSSAFGGAYHVVNDGAKALTVTAADAQPRFDLVIAEVTAASWQLRVVKGVAGATPAEPATPADSIVLAVITVGASVAVLSASTVDDRRIFSEAMRLTTDLGWRNALRNGDMGVAQRGNGAFSTSATWTIDGWLLSFSGAAGPAVTRVVSPVGTGLGQDGAPAYAQVSTAAQAAAGDFVVFQHRIESVRTFAGKVVTLSFLASTNAGTPKIGVEIVQNFGTGGAPSADVQLAIKAVKVSTVLARYYVTFTVPSIVGKTLGTAGNDYLTLNLWMSAGATNAARASSIGIQLVTFFITDLQLEMGPVATPFERLPMPVQLAWNQRYYYRVGDKIANEVIGYGLSISATQAIAPFTLPVPMRAAPTFAVTGPTGFTVGDGGAGSATTAVGVDILPGPGGNIGSLQFTVAAGLTLGRACRVIRNGAGSFVEFLAEL